MSRTPPTAPRARLRLEPLEGRAVPARFAVTTTLDVVDSSDGRVSLREAISRANSHPGPDTVALPPGVFRIALDGANEDGNAIGDFDVTDDLLIRGSGSAVTAIDGQYKDRLFDLLGSIHMQFSGLTLRRGGGAMDGGAVQALVADVALVRCVLSDNRGLSGGGFHAGTGNISVVGSTVCRNLAQGAGGIGVEAGTLTLKGSVVRNNRAQSGGGIFALTATVVNSTVSGNSATFFGGGIVAGTVTLAASKVVDNSADFDGGGIYGSESITATNSTVSGNTAAGGGGGIFLDSFTFGTVMLTHSVVRGNFAATGLGGGISAPQVTVTDSTVSGNTTGSAAGGINASDTATVTRSMVSENAAALDGGGIAAGRLTLTDSTVGDNSAGRDGGGIYAASISGGPATLTNSTVAGNRAGRDGGGIAVFVESTLRNCTVAENAAGGRGAGVFRGPTATQPVSVINTIIARNLVDLGSTGSDAFGAFVSEGHNLIGDDTGSTGFTNAVNADLVGTAASPIDPGLGPLRNNGGGTLTMALLAGSPAIDHADNANAPANDQRGLARKKDGNGDGIAVVDIGAFER